MIYQERVKLDQPEMNFTFEVGQLPVKAAVDPKRLLIERVYSDNVKSLEVN